MYDNILSYLSLRKKKVVIKDGKQLSIVASKIVNIVIVIVIDKMILDAFILTASNFCVACCL